MVKCVNCGHENWSNAKFCEDCGCSLNLNEPVVESNAEIPVVKTSVIESMIKTKVNEPVDEVVDESGGESGVKDSVSEFDVDGSVDGPGVCDSDVDGSVDRYAIDGSVREYVVDGSVSVSIIDESVGVPVVDESVGESSVESAVSEHSTNEINMGEMFTTGTDESVTDDGDVNSLESYSKNPAIAFFLSLLFLSLGQFYNGQILKGIIFVLAIFVLFNIIYPFGSILGFLIIIYSAIDAYLNAKAITKNNGNYFYNTNQRSV
ncbi:MAG: hypothetical protein LBU74_07945 [Methanobacteriaceae archaeon]|jgi:TM2 domain-containing membrane protein YozV|nr:hypothetical protein [Candidatus Methanorudis spinitermitis]